MVAKFFGRSTVSILLAFGLMFPAYGDDITKTITSNYSQSRVMIQNTKTKNYEYHDNHTYNVKIASGHSAKITVKVESSSGVGCTGSLRTYFGTDLTALYDGDTKSKTFTSDVTVQLGAYLTSVDLSSFCLQYYYTIAVEYDGSGSGGGKDITVLLDPNGGKWQTKSGYTGEWYDYDPTFGLGTPLFSSSHTITLPSGSYVGTALDFPRYEETGMFGITGWQVVRNGYDLDGWFTAASGGVRVTASTVVKEGEYEGIVTYYAHWKSSSMPPSAPSAPIGVAATDGTYSDKVSVSWSAASGATSYNLYRSTSSTRPSAATKTDVTSPYSDTTATPGVKYYYWVSAVNSAGPSFSTSDTGYCAVSLSLEKSSDTFAAVGGDGSATVTANTSWSASADVGWITFGTASGSGNGTLTYTVAASTSTVPRTGTITVTAGTSYPATKSITVTQAAVAHVSSISITGPDYVYAGKTGTFAATAAMSDGTTKSITPTWSIYSGTSYASISTAGVLTGKTVSSAQTVTVKASYTEGGVTKTATKTVTVYPTFTLATALDNSTLTFTTGGNADWFGQGKTTYDGTDAARSGIITHNQNSWMQTTVIGPGTFSFRWYASSEIGSSSWYDYLTFSIDGVQTNKIGGTSCSWTQCSYTLGAGSHTLKWNYLKDGSQNKGEDAGFVDQVVWTPAPVLPDAPTDVSATDGTYSDKVSISWTGSSGATSYNLYRSTSSTRPSTATKTSVTSPCEDKTATPGVKYYYWVEAVNSAGSAVSSYDTGYCAIPLKVTAATAQQRYPWNGLVDITVTIQGMKEDVADVDCAFAATNSSTQAEIPVAHIEHNGEDRGSGTTWIRKFIWDAKADVGAVRIDDVALTVEVEISTDGVQLWENGPYWAKCNVGATKPEEYGYYFCWGDTIGYKRNSADNGWVSVKDDSAFSFDSENCPTYGKDNSQLQAAGYIDATGNLVALHDAATAHLGAPWRMPTDAEFDALIDNCTTTWTTRNGVFGRLVTGKGAYASRSIFLPAAGRGLDTNLIFMGSDGDVWSSTPDSAGSNNAWYLGFNSSCLDRWYYGGRRSGKSVRPVRGFANGDSTGITRGAAVTTNLALDCRGAKVVDSNHPLVYDASWYEDGVTVKVMANGEKIVSGASGIYAWVPPSDGVYRLTLNVYDALDKMVGTESVFCLSREDLTELVIPEGTTAIDEYAFAGGQFTSVTIPSSVTYIGYYAFDGCSGLNTVYVSFSDTERVKGLMTGKGVDVNTLNFVEPKKPDGGPYTQEVDGIVWTYMVKNGEASVGFSYRPIPLLANSNVMGLSEIGGDAWFSTAIPPTTVGAITIPLSLGGCPVMSIGDDAFSGCSYLTSVTIPSSVTSIGYSAFYDCSALTSVTIPSSVTSIGNYAFRGCSSLTSVTIPEGVTIISGGAFYGCSALTSVTIPSSVTSIGELGFYDCSALTSVTIPSSVTSIGEWAFGGCSTLTSVTIPSSVTDIGELAFLSCSTLTRINVDSANRYYCSIGGVLYNKDATELICCPSGAKSVTIPSSVTSIGSWTFYGCSSLTSVTIPSSVTSIGEYAFYCCNGLMIVTIPSSVMSIETDAFYGCSSLKVVCVSGNGDIGVVKQKLSQSGLNVNNITFTHVDYYSVLFNANGGEGSMTSQNITYGVSTALKANAFTHSGYVFAGWATTADGPVAYADNASVLNLALPESSITLYAVWEKVVVPAPSVSPADGATFSTDSCLVALDCAMDGAAIYYTTNGATPKTSASYLYTQPFEIRGTVNVKAVAVKDGVKSEYVTATITKVDPVPVETPVITPVHGTTFSTDSCEVTITCPTDGATIYYTTDGTLPTVSESCRYKGAFSITDTATIKAIAVKEGWLESACASVTITKVGLTLDGVLGVDSRVRVTTGGEADWVPVNDVNAKEGGTSARSGLGNTDDDSVSWIQLSVNGKGTLSFWCKTSCEHDDDNAYTWDRVEVTVDGQAKPDWYMDGTSQWVQRTIVFDTVAEHTIRIAYVKDESDFDGEDCAWIDEVKWEPETADGAVIADVTALKEAFGAESSVVRNLTSEEELVKFNEFLGKCGITTASQISDKQKQYAYESFRMSAIMVEPQLFENEPKLNIHEFKQGEGGWSVSISLKAGEDEIAMARKALEEHISVGNKLTEITAKPDIVARPSEDGSSLTFTIAPPEGKQAFIMVR